MASSLHATPASLSSSFSCSSSQAAISSSGSSFVSIALFKQASREPNHSKSSVFPTVECSSRPQKKCTAHHVKTRPKKHSLADKNRKPPVYPKPPKAPPIITLGWGDEDDAPAPAAQPAVVEALA
eukprot:c7529_g1_i1 orf=341-715(-)